MMGHLPRLCGSPEWLSPCEQDICRSLVPPESLVSTPDLISADWRGGDETTRWMLTLSWLDLTKFGSVMTEGSEIRGFGRAHRYPLLHQPWCEL